jgi:hypothetical protein
MPIALACLISLVSVDAAAQSFALVIDANGTCPRREDLVRINPALEEGSVGGLVNRIATPARSGLRIYPTSILRGAPIEGVTLTFDDEVEVLVGTPLGQSGGGPALIQRLREARCGWINVADLERFAQPMRLLEIPPFGRESNRSGEANRLEARVVVKNRFALQTGYAQRAPLFNAPFTSDVEPPQDQRRGSIGFLEVLSVFEVRQANGQPCRTFRDANCFLRVGSTTSLAGRSTGLVRTRGWVRGPDVEIWPGPLALYYRAGKRGLKIHLTEQSARIGTPFATAGAREAVLAYQPEGRFEEPRERNIVRFPVIRAIRLAESNQSSSETNARSTHDSYVYEILFNGQACIENILGGQQGDCVPEPEIKDEVARFGEAFRAIANIDVMLVVSAAQGMGPYLQSVVRALRRHLERATANRQWSFRYSVVVYGDYNRKREGGLDYDALPFTSDMSGLEALQKLGIYQDENKDVPAAPFAALERAAKTANWRREAANRLIIWIADHGNRPPGTKIPAGSLTETKTAQSVVDAIKEADARLRGSGNATGGGTKTRFLAIQVKGGATGAGVSDQFFQKFRQDAEAIRQGLGETTFTTIPSAVTRGATQDQPALVDAITTQVDRSVAAVAEARRMVLGALGGETTGLQPNLPPSGALLARDFLAALGFPAERLQEMGRRIQIVRNGFVYQSARDPDYRYWLGLNQQEFNDIRNKANVLCENLRHVDRINMVESSILALVRAVTFTEMRPSESVREFYSRFFSVPAHAMSPTIREASPTDFVRALRGRPSAQQERVVGEICKKAQLLQYIGNGQIIDLNDLVFEQDRVRLRRNVTPRDFDWRWITNDAQTVWYFILLDVLP